MPQTDSVEKIITRYFRVLTKEPFTYDGVTYNPKPLDVPPEIQRDFTCPVNCGGCCGNFSLDYLPSEKQPDGVTERAVEFNGKQIHIFTDWQKSNKTNRCHHMNRVDGRCGIYEVSPFSCDFELIRVFQYANRPNRITQQEYGRGSLMKRVDGGVGALCERIPMSEETKSNAVRKLKRFIEWADHFGVVTWAPEIISLIEQGKLTETITLTPEGYEEQNQASRAVKLPDPVADSPQPTEQRESPAENAIAGDPAPSTKGNDTTKSCTSAASKKAERLGQIESELRDLKVRMARVQSLALSLARRIGDLLNEAKESLPHGQFKKWRAEHFGGSDTSAERYQLISEYWEDIKLRLEEIPDLSMTDAADHARELKKGSKETVPTPVQVLRDYHYTYDKWLRTKSHKCWQGVDSFNPLQKETAVRRQKSLLMHHRRFVGHLPPLPEPSDIGLLFLDSGAFHLREIAKVYDGGPGKYYRSDEFYDFVDGFAAFVKQYGEAIDYHATVDAIGFPEITREIQIYLEQRHTLHPIPVVHLGADSVWLKKYIEDGHTYIGLGGDIGPGEECERWLEKMFTTAKDMAGDTIRLHGFGVFSNQLLRKFPWWSVDAATAVKVAGFGEIMFPHLTADGKSFDFTRPYHSVNVTNEGWNPSESEMRWLRFVSGEFAENHPYTGEYEPEDDFIRLVPTHHTWRERANQTYLKKLELQLKLSGKDIRFFISGGADAFSRPEHLYGKEANWMPTYDDMTRNVTRRFLDVYLANCEAIINQLKHKKILAKRPRSRSAV